MRTFVPRLALIATAAGMVLTGCGGGDSTPPAQDTGPAPLTVPKVASCATGDHPESGLQGQVPAAQRTSFKGFNCNLSLVGQFQGEGGNWSSAAFTDGAGHSCAYHSTSVPSATRQNPGVPVIDITNRSNPVRLASLTTPAMMDSWESLRVHARRQFLIADNGQNGGGGPEIDIYDLSGDCRTPQLLASTAVGTGADGGVVGAATPVGHEGNLSLDGLTYYIGDTTNRMYHAVDITNTTKPKVIASFDMKTLGLRAHGLSVSADGNRVYATTPFNPTPSDVGVTAKNGFVVLDTSEVQARKPNAQIKHISSVLYTDGSASQHTIPIKVAGKPYVVQVDEIGSGPLEDPVGVRLACNAGLAPFAMGRIYDISDDTKPALVSKLMLETHDIKNCDQVLPDIDGLTIFTYGSHYCSVDNRENATVLACSYFNSGIRVFDIRNPARPKEIAYYNPGATAQAQVGSSQGLFGQWRAGGADWCASRVDFDFAKKQLITMCQSNGLLVLQFAPNTWPFSESVPSLEHN